VLAALLLPAGCGGGRGALRVQDYAPRPVDKIDVIGLRLTPPAPVNWDERPGADGLQMQVNFFRQDEALSVTVRGSLELTLYEGKLRPEQLAAARPLRTWRFEGAELSTYCGKSAFGWGYAMRLPWGASPPPGANATLGSRYTSPGGRVVAGRPIIVPLGPR
jgi:hypothetical protein